MRLCIAMNHQCINSTSFLFSAVVLALLAVSALEGINAAEHTVDSEHPTRERVHDPCHAGLYLSTCNPLPPPRQVALTDFCTTYVIFLFRVPLVLGSEG